MPLAWFDAGFGFAFRVAGENFEICRLRFLYWLLALANYLQSPFAQLVNCCLCFRMSANPGLLSKKRKGFPRKFLSVSPEPSKKPASPSLSIFPAQVFHSIGLSVCEPRTRPRQIINVAAIVSMQMSMGSELLACCCDSACLASVEDRAVCSCAE